MAPFHKSYLMKLWRTPFHTITNQFSSHADLFHQRKKDNAIRPVGAGECKWRIIDKTIIGLLKEGIIHADCSGNTSDMCGTGIRHKSSNTCCKLSWFLFGDNWYLARISQTSARAPGHCRNQKVIESMLNSRISFVTVQFHHVVLCIHGKKLLDDQHSCAGVLGRNRFLLVGGLLRSTRIWAWQRKYKSS